MKKPARMNHVFMVGSTVFMKHPTIRGVWIRTDSSVVLADCDYCKAKKGELCKGKTKSGRTCGTHSARRQVANIKRGRIRKQPKIMIHFER